MSRAEVLDLDGCRCVAIDELTLPFRIGIYETERGDPQEVKIWVRMFVPESGPAESRDIADYVSYEDLVIKIESLAKSGRHIPLAENLAEEIAALALEDKRVARVVVDVRKTEIIPAAAGVGVTIERAQGGWPTTSR